ncbi:MAG: septum formation inhibitor Maf [Burkholderiales bacterium]|nr:MAG: septum formation inhibitor Maf [Burkholderiales bacterium]
MTEPEPAPPPLILASSSRYRRALLERLMLPFDCVAPDIDERARPNETPVALCQRLALEKARAIGQARPDAWVIGCDQVAVLDGRTIGKPGDHARAVAQLEAVSGREVMFHTALCLYQHADQRADTLVAHTRVKFRRLERPEIETYLRMERPFDCAGSARCEGLGIALLRSIHGDDPSALVGLPLIALCALLRKWGYPLLSAAHEARSAAPAQAGTGGTGGQQTS